MTSPSKSCSQPPLEQLALEQEAARDVVGGALDRHRVALARRAQSPAPGSREASRRVLPAADRRQQRAVADEVRVAADRRGEVAVVRRARGPAWPRLRGVVAGLLERAQHEAAQPEPAVAGASRRAARRGARPAAIASAACCGVGCSGTGGVGDAERGELRDEPLDRLALGPLVDAVAAPAPCARRAAARPASLATIIRCSIRRCDSVCTTPLGGGHVAVARRTRTPARTTRSPARRRARALLVQRRRRLARRRERLRPRLLRRARRRRRCGRPRS